MGGGVSLLSFLFLVSDGGVDIMVGLVEGERHTDSGKIRLGLLGLVGLVGLLGLIAQANRSCCRD